MLDLLKFVLPIGLLKLSLGGGGGGSGEREATPEERRLWAAQAGALEGMTEISMPVLQTGMNNLGTLANESMDGTLATRLRNQAVGDANIALGTSANDALRELHSTGANFNPNRSAEIAAQWGLGAAKQRSSAANLATMGAEDLKWNRNSALTGLASGQGAQAVSGMGSLASQIGQHRQANMQADAQSMQGLGMAGAWAGNKFFKDGGEVRLANGGGLRSFKPTSVKFAPWEISGSDGYKGPSTLDQVGAFATPIAMHMAADAAKPYVKDGISAVKGLFDVAPSSSTGAVVPPSTPNFGPGGVDALTDAAVKGATNEAGLLGSGTTAPVGGDTLVATTGELAKDAALTTATEAGGAGLMSSVGAALPWVGGALLVGKALDLFADGGEVKGNGLRRKDMTNGGKVKGPGTETSDSIPARLSDGEYVLNAEAVKLVGKDKLDAINNMGLRARGDDVEMAGGGFLYGLGQAARGFVPTAMALDQQDEQKKQWEAQNKRADAAEARANTQFQWLEGDHKRKMDIQAASDAHNKKWADIFKRVGEGDYSDIPTLVKSFNNQEGAFNDGTTLTFQSTPQGSVMNHIGADGKLLTSKPMDRQTVMEGLQQAALAEKAMLLGGDLAGYVQGERKHGLEVSKLGIERDRLTAQRPLWANQARYFGNKANEPDTIANGSWVPDGKGGYRQLYNAPPDRGGGQRQGQPLGMTDDGQMIVPDGKGGFATQPIMVNGKPASPDQVNMFKKMHGVGQQETLSPEEVNIHALIKKGEAQPEHFQQLKAIGVVKSLRQRFESQAEHDRNSAVMDLVRILPQYAETPEAQSRLLTEMGVSPAEVEAYKKAAKGGGVLRVPGALGASHTNKPAPWRATWDDVRYAN